MKFETVRIHFLSDVLVCCHPGILLPKQREVTTSPFYYGQIKPVLSHPTLGTACVVIRHPTGEHRRCQNLLGKQNSSASLLIRKTAIRIRKSILKKWTSKGFLTLRMPKWEKLPTIVGYTHPMYQCGGMVHVPTENRIVNGTELIWIQWKPNTCAIRETIISQIPCKQWAISQL